VCTSVEVWQLYAESRQSQDFLSSYIVQNGHSISVSGWNNEEADIYIQKRNTALHRDCNLHNKITCVGACVMAGQWNPRQTLAQSSLK